MRFLLFIFLIIYFPALSQPTGNKNLFLTNAVTSPRPAGFDWDALTPQSPTAYTNAGTVVIDAKSFTNLNTGVLDGDLVQLRGTGNIIFKNCYFGPAIRNAATVGDGYTGFVRFENCLFVSEKMGIEVATSSCTIEVDNCQFINMFGAGQCKGQAFQASNSTMTNSYIRNCVIAGYRGLSSYEDMISFFNSGGTASSYFVVSDNIGFGGGPSISGGGFMTGDHGGGYIIIENNKLLEAGNYQFAASGGNDIIIRNNLAYSSNQYSRIGYYAYGQAGAACSNITVMSNGSFITNGNYWYPGDGSPAEYCGIITGSNPWFTQTNLQGITLSQLNFPSSPITFVDEDRLWHLKEEGVQFRGVTGSCIGDDVPVLSTVPIPTPNAGADQIIGGTSATLNASGSTSSNGLNYQWVFVSGPATPTIVSPFAVSTSVSGLTVSGVYEFRVQVTDNSGAARADWMTVTKS